VPAALERIFEMRQQRLERRQQEAEELAKPNAWRELVRIGTAMMGTQSPQFGQGLAQGLMATVEEQQKRREALRRERAAIEEAREGIELGRYEQTEKARERAIARTTAADAAADRAVQRQDAAVRSYVGAIEAADTPAKLKRLEDKAAQDAALNDAQIANIRSTIATRAAELGISQRELAIKERDARDGGGKSMTPGQRVEFRQKVNEAASTFNAAARAYEAERKAKKNDLDKMDQTIVDNYLKARQDFESVSQLEREITGRSTFIRRPFTGGMGGMGGAAGSAASPASSGVIDYGSLPK
jgi:hypothetical protein